MMYLSYRVNKQRNTIGSQLFVLIFTARVRSTREGNVLTSVCPSIHPSVCPQGGWVRYPPGGSGTPGGVPGTPPGGRGLGTPLGGSGYPPWGVRVPPGGVLGSGYPPWGCPGSGYSPGGVRYPPGGVQVKNK